jgi:radical SAM protein with 4Fe4S-binding SPASM domain
MEAIKVFLKIGVITNIHYVLGRNSIDEAVTRLKDKSFPEGVNAVIFLLHKPVGFGQRENIIPINHPRLKEFFELVDGGDFPFHIGFDSCTVPGVINFSKNIMRESLDTCEGGRFSMYITPDMIALPCSFDQAHRFGYNISNDTVQNAWNSTEFENFRNIMRNSCPDCADRYECKGGCPLESEIVLCNREQRDKREGE